jgi:hypothetical protein
MSALDQVLDRLSNHKLRESTPGRWRAICPCCGEKNGNTLSIGEGDTGAVLIKCFKVGCGPEQIALALGLELTDLFPPKPAAGSGNGPAPRRRMLSAAQALELVEQEMLLAVVCAADLSQGLGLDEATRQRLTLGAARVSMLRQEARA